jgi:hypothetical protein
MNLLIIGGDATTSIFVEALFVNPVRPVHRISKVEVDDTVLSSLPLRAADPDHAPSLEHEVAFTELQVSRTVLPDLMRVELAVSVTFG